MIIRRIQPMSAAKVGGALYALLGLVFGICISALALIGGGMMKEAMPMSGLFGVGAVIFLPILYGVIGFIMMWLTAALYNVAAGVAGGLNIETE